MWIKFPLASQLNSLETAVPKFTNSDIKQDLQKGLVVALGNFDGLHLGHQKLVQVVRQQAQLLNMRSALITFLPHPAKIIKGSSPKRLTSLRQLIELVAQQQIDDLIILRFTKKLSQLEAEEFVDQILIDRFNVKHLVIGPFAGIGKNRKGTSEWIIDYFEQKGLSTSLVQPFALSAERISSNQIRECIRCGELEYTAQLLGRPYSISKRVISGQGRGKVLGFPTANLNISEYVKPPYGVYFCSARLNNKNYFSLANFGLRPTFNGREEMLEAFLIDYEGSNFYGQKLELTFLKKIRDEIRFESVDLLKQQIQSDLQTARELIEKRV